MKLFEKLIYSGVLFVFVYVVVSLGLEMFNIVSSRNAHMIGGIIATVLGMMLFMFLLIKKEEERTF